MRSFLKLALAAFLAVSGISSSFAQEITVEEIAEKMAKAVDPNGVYAQCKSYFLKQKLSMEKVECIVEATYKVPNMSRSVTYVNGKPVYKVLFSKDKAWVIDNRDVTSEMQGAHLDNMKIMNKMQEPTATLVKVFPKVELDKDETAKTEFFVLKCYYGKDQKEVMTYYVDKKDFLTRKVVTVKDNMPYVVESRKYSLLEGVLIATETMVEFAKRKEILTVLDYKLNIDVPDSDFIPPEPPPKEQPEKKN